MIDKLMSMEEAINLVQDGDTIWINSFSAVASPMALAPEAQAVTAGMAGPLQPKRMAIMPEAMLAIIMGMQ